MDSTFLCNSIVNFTNCCSSLNPCCLIFDVNIDQSEINKINDDEWRITEITAACTSSSWMGVTMNRGFGVVVFMNLRSFIKDCKSCVYEALFGVWMLCETLEWD